MRANRVFFRPSREASVRQALDRQQVRHRCAGRALFFQGLGETRPKRVEGSIEASLLFRIAYEHATTGLLHVVARSKTNLSKRTREQNDAIWLSTKPECAQQSTKHDAVGSDGRLDHASAALRASTTRVARSCCLTFLTSSWYLSKAPMV